MEDKNNLYIVGIVGIVAIIGIAVMVLSGGNRDTQDYGSVAYDSTGQVIAPVGVTTTTSTVDYTPRIAYWYGKVNQHINTATGRWETDPDGRSGADINMLTYCKKWYPRTTSVTAYKMEYITGWRNAGNTGYYTSTKQSYKCVQGTTAPVCGNGILESGEQCDGSIRNINCGNLGFMGGNLSCSKNCTYNLNNCVRTVYPNATTTTCYDSDGGMNGNVAGYVTFNNYTVRDSCSNQSTVSEAICNNGFLEWWPVYCSYNCTAGRCI